MEGWSFGAAETDDGEERRGVGCDEAAGDRVGCEDGDGEGLAWVAAPVAGTALVAGADADVPAARPQAVRARAGAQASTRMAAGRASRMGRDVSKSAVPEWHLYLSVARTEGIFYREVAETAAVLEIFR
jgi:hypothetical protein